MIKKDEIFNLRLSRHYSTKNATKKSFIRNGKSDIEYHLIVERTSPSVSGSITHDCILSNVPILVREYDIADFNDDDKRASIVDEIVYLLTHGTDGLSENKQYNNNANNKQTLRFTESDLRWMVVESVRKILAQRRMIG